MKHFFPLFSAWNYFIYFRIYSLFIFSLIFFFYCLFITSILGSKQNLQCPLFYYYYKSRVTMREIVLKILSIFTFFSDITYETLRCRGFVWNEKKIFCFILCWFIFFHLIDKDFNPVREFLFCNKFDRIRRQNFGAKIG